MYENDDSGFKTRERPAASKPTICTDGGQTWPHPLTNAATFSGDHPETLWVARSTTTGRIVDAFTSDRVAAFVEDAIEAQLTIVDLTSLETAREVAADGGTTWADLTAFQRDCLEAIHRLDSADETSYGLAIKRELEHRYDDEINHGRLYPNLDHLVDHGLVAKAELDKRTNEYQLTDSARAMLESRAKRLADTCGFMLRRPAADGGEDE